MKKITTGLMFSECSSLREFYLGTNDDGLSITKGDFYRCNMSSMKLYVPEEYVEFYRTKRPGEIAMTRVYPDGEKMGEVLVHDFNIGTYVVHDNGDSTYTLVTSNIDYSESLTIPATFNEKPITRICDYAFANQSFTNVTLKLGDNIEYIGKFAFSKLNGLVKVEFGDSLKIIDSSAFASCSNLIQDLVLPDSMERIESEAFSGTGITSLNTGGTVSIETKAFTGCTSLIYVIMPEVTTIAESGTNTVFWNCTQLVSVDMPKVSKVYGKGLFYNCSSLREIYMAYDSADVSLGEYPFTGVKNSLAKLYVPEHLVATYQQVKVLSTVSKIYPRGEKMGDLTVNGFNVGAYIVIENDDGYTMVTSNLDYEGEVQIPDVFNDRPITEVYTNAFRNQTFTDATLVFGDNLKTIGETAFYQVEGLKAVVIDQVTAIGKEAFRNSSIRVLNAPKLTTLADNAFRACSDLESVSIPKVETIDAGYVFSHCPSLKSVYFENIMSVSFYTFYEDTNLEKITINRIIDADSSNMPSTMILRQSPLSKIYVPHESLEKYTKVWSERPVVTFDLVAYQNGDSYILKDVKGKYALIDFETPAMLSALTIPESLTVDGVGQVTIFSIENGALSAVAGTLKDLTIAATVAQLGSTALSECTKLENIYVNAESVYFTSIEGVLFNRSGSMLVRFPAGRSGTVDLTGSAFMSTKFIGSGAFNNATKLTEIVFNSSLEVIDGKAFIGCTQLNTVKFTGSVAPTLMGAAIFSTDVEYFRMLIPAAHVDTYRSTFNFAEYESYFELY